MPETWSAPAGENELWHVLVAPGDTKLLSLDQLDDFFRLEVINGSTPVWQPGMNAWLPLSVVAGLDDESEEPAPAGVPARAAAPAPRPPAPPARASAPRRPPPKPPSRPRTAPPPQQHQGQRRPQHLVQTAKAWPPAVPPIGSPLPAPGARPQATRGPSFAPAPHPYNIPAPESLRPLVLPDPSLSFRPEPQKSALGSWLVGLAALAAAVISLHRNDVLRDLAKSAGQEKPYLELESSVGSPGFGTPRAVERLPTLDSLTTTSPNIQSALTASTSSPNTAPAPAPTILPDAAPTAADAPTTAAAPATTSEAAVATLAPSGTSAETEAEPEPTTRSAPPSSRSTSKASRSKKAQASRANPRRSAAPTKRAERPEKQPEREQPASLGVRGGTNRFDPLNGNF